MRETNRRRKKKSACARVSALGDEVVNVRECNCTDFRIYNFVVFVSIRPTNEFQQPIVHEVDLAWIQTMSMPSHSAFFFRYDLADWFHASLISNVRAKLLRDNRLLKSVEIHNDRIHRCLKKIMIDFSSRNSKLGLE